MQGTHARLSVCVIGAGAIGLASALELARRGVSEVVVLESSHVGAGSSGRSAGIVETQYLDPLDIELRVRAMRGFDELEREHGLQIVRNGYLRLARTTTAAQAFDRSVQLQRELGVKDVCALDPKQIAKLVPDLRVDDLQAGLWGKHDGYLDGDLYCELLAELAVAAGAKLLLGQRLVGVEEIDDFGLRLCTSAGVLQCDAAINAAGAWAAEVASLFGYELALTPQRRQAAAVRLTRGLAYRMPSVMDYSPTDGEPGLYFRDDGPARLIAGLHGEQQSEPLPADPDRYLHHADAEFLRRLAHKLADRLPSLADETVLARGWAGLYPVSATGRPLLGPIEASSRLLMAGGAGGSGIQLAPVLGELAADWVLYGEPRALAGATVLSPLARL